MKNSKQLLEYAKDQNATDIHICAGAPILFRVNRKLLAVTTEKLTPDQSRDLAFELLNDEQRLKLEEKLDYDFMLADFGGRFRINAGYFNESIGMTIRVLSDKPSSIEKLFLPKVVRELAHHKKGMILVTGSTSQGKTTTLTAMIDEINRTQKKHIITIEDPIEYIHTNKKGIVRQRQINRDTQSFATGLRAALRQDPDVIAIGEMRDYETIEIALSAAETGVLVLSTLHIISVDKIMERLLSYAPAAHKDQLRFLLAESLQGVIHQELIPTVSGSQRVACEILIATNAAKNIIRRKDGYLLRSVLSTGKKHGMCTMSESVGKLLDEGLITDDAAKSVLVNYSN